MSAKYVLPDVLAPDLNIVFCGTAPGHASAAQRAYYAGPGNRFWPALFAAGLTPRQLLPAEFRTVLEFKLGLTDLAKTVSGMDHSLQPEDFNITGLRTKIKRVRPRLLAFTSKRAGAEFLGHAVDYGLQDERIGQTRLFVLPSPSGQARRYWRLDPWRELARFSVAGQAR